MHTLPEKKVIAITGSMGSGKSQVSKYIANFYPVIDCDRINADLIKKDHEGYRKLVQFDWIVLDKNYEIDKTKMASSMFSDKTKKKQVEQILHPLIFEQIDKWKQEQQSSLVFVEVPILFEIQAQSKFDEIWCVYCDEQVALERLVKYRHFTLEQAKQRLQHQFSVEYKKQNSDVCIENNGGLEQLEKKIDELLEKRSVNGK